MASKPDRAAPFWFFKPSTSYLPQNAGPILIPRNALVHHEGISFSILTTHNLHPKNLTNKPSLVELAVVIGKPARDVPASRATDHIAGYVCAIDLTARNWQSEAKAIGRPWSLAKGCDTFLPLSTVVPPDAIRIDQNGVADVTLWLDVNGERRQCASTKHMIHTIPELIEHISSHVTLEEWDLILTGTPSGVGELHAGDTVKAGIEGLVEMEFYAEDRCNQGQSLTDAHN